MSACNICPADGWIRSTLQVLSPSFIDEISSRQTRAAPCCRASQATTKIGDAIEQSAEKLSCRELPSLSITFTAAAGLICKKVAAVSRW